MGVEGPRRVGPSNGFTLHGNRHYGSKDSLDHLESFKLDLFPNLTYCPS